MGPLCPEGEPEAGSACNSTAINCLYDVCGDSTSKMFSCRAVVGNSHGLAAPSTPSTVLGSVPCSSPTVRRSKVSNAATWRTVAAPNPRRNPSLRVVNRADGLCGGRREPRPAPSAKSTTREERHAICRWLASRPVATRSRATGSRWSRNASMGFGASRRSAASSFQAFSSAQKTSRPAFAKFPSP
jgi:hypothetical protein